MSLFSRQSAKSCVSFGRLLWARVNHDRVSMMAGSLAYISLLSLVPLVTVIFSLFAAFPMFGEVSEQLKHFIFTNFVPAAGDVVQSYLEQLAQSNPAPYCLFICHLLDGTYAWADSRRCQYGNQHLLIIDPLASHGWRVFTGRSGTTYLPVTIVMRQLLVNLLRGADSKSPCP